MNRFQRFCMELSIVLPYILSFIVLCFVIFFLIRIPTPYAMGLGAFLVLIGCAIYGDVLRRTDV